MGNDGVGKSAISITKTKEKGFGLSIGVSYGPASIGGSISKSKSKSEGLLVLIDIDGDGLLDKIFKKDGFVYYRPNLSTAKDGLAGQFGEPRFIAGLPEISIENTESVTKSISAGIGPVSASASKNKSKTEQPIFFLDDNSDGLIDLVYNGNVLFNHRAPDGRIFFTLNSADSAYPIGNGAAIMAGITESYSEAKQQFLNEYPLLDTARRWLAPYDGQIRITAPVALIQDNSAERQAYTQADGVRVAIQHNLSEIWSTTIAATDYVAKTPTGVSTLTVKKGDAIYFRVASIEDGSYDQVQWNPIIEYLSVTSTADANQQDVYRYEAQKDYTIASGHRDASITMPIGGKVHLEGVLQKLGITSDDVTLQVLKNDNIIYSQILQHDQVGNLSLGQDVDVNKDDHLAVHLKIDSRIDISQLKWDQATPLNAYYIVSNDPDITELTDAQGKPLYQGNLLPSYDLYPLNYLTTALPSWTAPQSGLYTVQPALALATGQVVANSTVTMTVKNSTGELLAKKTLIVANNTVQNSGFTFTATQGDKLFFEFSTLDATLVTKLSQISAGVLYPNSTTGISVPVEFYSAEERQFIAQSYRGWSIFGYNGNGARANQAMQINTGDLAGTNLATALQALQTEFDTAKQSIDATNEAEMQALLEQFADKQAAIVESLPIYPFFPNINTQHWQSPDDNAWVSKDSMSSSRNGIDTIDIPQGVVLATANAISRFSKCEGKSVSIGAGVSMSKTTSDCDSEKDMLDGNGDRFPDFWTTSGTQHTNMLGGLEAQIRNMLSDSLRHTESETTNYGLGVSKSKSISNSRAGVDTNSCKAPGGNYSAQVGGYVSLGKSKGDSNVTYDLIDINGDGIPDRVSDSLMVQLGIGYSFLPPEKWGDIDINYGKHNGKDVGVGANIGGSYNGIGLSVGGGVSGGNSKSESVRSFADMNGDGLLDAIIQGDVLMVMINTGNQFAAAVPWPTGGDASLTRSTTKGMNASINASIPVGTTGVGISFGASVQQSETYSYQEIQVNMDIDGDNYPDALYSNSDSSLTVGLSKIKRTHLLKTVKNPLGGTFTLGYARAGNTFEQPHSQWVMSRLEVNDGHAGDGVDVLLKTFRYENGFYDRQEREFYGYQTVVEEDRDITQAEKLYRYVTQTFLNNSYYNKGLLQQEVLTDANGKKQTETENTYFLLDLATGGALADLNNLTARVFPQLQRTDKRFYEGQETAGKYTYELFEYDNFGNVSRYINGNEVGNADDVDVKIGYFQDLTNYIVGKPNSVQVFGGGVLMRKRESTIEAGTGNLRQVRAYLANGNVAISDLSYDEYGNLIEVTGPSNYRGQRFSQYYQYDNQLKTYPERITDSFGYTSSQRYNVKQGAIESSTDINNNTILTTLDEFGRVTVIRDPYALERGYPYTIRAEYHHDAPVPYAITQHIDPYRTVNDPIETISFMDGLKRVIQTKKDGTIHHSPTATAQDKMIVSGHIVYDFVGRTIAQYYPVVENLGQGGQFNPSIDNIAPTQTAYDILDRTTQTIAPDNTITSMSYGFGNDRDGRLQFLTRVTDANGIPKETYHDINESITAVKEFNKQGSEIIWNSMAYDPLKQIINVWDDHKNQTTVVYDNLGRRVSIHNPDTGLMQWRYDMASNVTQYVTDNLRQNSQAVNYEYDYTRLSKINYPIFPDTNVSYSYGGPGAPYNRAGRIVKVFDQSGSQESFYGKLGETIKTIRTIASETQGNSANSPEIYTTEYEFDSFARLHQLIYPDGEKLVNKYDSGGLLREIYGDKVSGAKRTNHYGYLDRLEYDKFSQRVYMEYANKVQHRYTYDERNRQLISLKTGFTPAKHRPDVFQDLTYQYDAVGNILGQENLAATTSPNQMGGKTKYGYQYDDLYRLIHAEGTFYGQPDTVQTYKVDMEYNTIHNITRKTQVHEIIKPSSTPLVQEFTSYDWAYSYGGAQPHAPTQIGPRSLTYDANGNQAGFTEPAGTKQRIAERTIAWDAENRIQSISNNGHTMRYKYDHTGERVFKLGPQGETAYINQFFSILNRQVATKHVFAGSTRIASKLAKQESLISKADIIGVRVADAADLRPLMFAASTHIMSDVIMTAAATNNGNSGNTGNASNSGNSSNNGNSGNNGNNSNGGNSCEHTGAGTPTHCDTTTTGTSTPADTTSSTTGTTGTSTPTDTTSSTTGTTGTSTPADTTGSTTGTTGTSTPADTTSSTTGTAGTSTPTDTTSSTTGTTGTSTPADTTGSTTGTTGTSTPTDTTSSTTGTTGTSTPTDTTGSTTGTTGTSTSTTTTNNGKGNGNSSNNGNSGSQGNLPSGVGPSERDDVYFYHPDHLGSSAFITDENAELFEHMEYFPFGEMFVWEKSNTQRIPYGFTGKELDEDTQLHYFGARYFDARTNVWQSADPILGDYLAGKRGMGGVFNSFNLGLYTYTHLNPVKFVDPDGNVPTKSQVGTIEGFLNEFGNAHGDWTQIKFSDQFASSKNRYIYTNKMGWVDMRHFLFFAAWQNLTDNSIRNADNVSTLVASLTGQPEAIPVIKGSALLLRILTPIASMYGSELAQHGKYLWDKKSNPTLRNDSFFTEEDLPSDLLGIVFAMTPKHGNSGQRISDLFKSIGATAPENANNYDKETGTYRWDDKPNFLPFPKDLLQRLRSDQ